MLGMAHDETATKDDSPTRPAIPQRAYSTAETPARSSTPVVAAEAGPAHPLSILSLDLKMGHSAAVSSSSSHSALLPSLSLQTLAHLLARRLASSLTHLSALKTRVSDTQSRILITGDLNAGKSTLVNALLRRKIMPVDQQPCTSVFAEVVDAKTWNNSVEEVHAIPDVAMYDPKDEATFERFDLGEVERLMDEGHGDDSDDDVETETQEKKTPAAAKYQMLKAYVMDSRAPVVEATEEEDDPAANPSFIRNSLVSISLIDAPGLNRDTLSTTALFARQSEIDVIVFVVSAENHFTLSAKEFLWNAAREKAYVFIVVNKWQGIRDKKRCMRVVGEQIRQLSPKTWDARDELVHFVDAADVFDDDGEPIPDTAAASEGEFDAVPPSFAELESALRTFVLLKRTTSKLAPARTYLLNLLADLSTLSATNVSAATAQLDRATAKLDDVRPVNDRLKRQRDEVEHGVDAVEEGTVEAVQRSAWSRLEQALAHVANGEVVPASASDEGSTPAYEDSLARPTELPVYPGLLGLWEWAADVKRTLVQALEVEVRAAEDDARKATSEGVKTVMDGLGNKYLPAAVAGQEDKNEAQVGPQRVFRPEVMFAKRRRGVGRLAARGVSAGLGLGVPTLGAANAWSVTDFDVSFFDLFDLDRLVSHGNLLRSGGKRSSKKKMISNGGDDDLLESSAIWGLGLGSVGMLGSRVIGVKGTMDSLTRVLELLGSDKARKWAGPVLGVISEYWRRVPGRLLLTLLLFCSRRPCRLHNRRPASCGAAQHWSQARVCSRRVLDTTSARVVIVDQRRPRTSYIILHRPRRANRPRDAQSSPTRWVGSA